MNFLQNILPFCIYKIPQIISAIEYIDTLNKKITEDIIIIREKCTENIKFEKHVDINIKNIQFKNQEDNKIFIKDCFESFTKLSYDDSLLYCKMNEIKLIKSSFELDNQIINGDVDYWRNININPILEFCETDKQLKKYSYYRKKVSSLPSAGVIGRAIRILVKDTISNKYIGVICLSSDVYNLGERDNYIKSTGNIDWNNKQVKDEFLKRVINISCCVPLQPFGFNTTGGKLLASLAFSKEVFDYYILKYQGPLQAIITTSINGKSIQYSGLKCLKMIGFTKGYGSVNIPEELYSVFKD